MRTEAYRAQTERQNSIRKKGEEAGTKLLLPMTIMLGIVMVLIMMLILGTELLVKNTLEKRDSE